MSRTLAPLVSGLIDRASSPAVQPNAVARTSFASRSSRAGSRSSERKWVGILSDRRRPPCSAVPAKVQLQDPAAGGGTRDEAEPVGLGDAVEQPRALARHVGEHAHGELVDQVELHE